MADKTIGELPVASELYDDSLLVVEQQREARSIKGELVKQFAREATADYAEQAADSAKAAKSDADRAKEMRDSIELDYTYIDTARTEAQESAQKAKDSENKAAASQTAAAGSASAAKASENNAKSSADAAKASQTAAKTSEDNAKSSATAADSSKSAAAASAAAAKASETAAGESETAAEASASSAAASASGASTSASEAKKSQDAAKASETAAKNSQTAAAGSATAAGTSASNASTSASDAAKSAAAAKTSQDAAKASETSAASSKTAAEDSASKAAESASSASTSATAAKASQTAAENFAIGETESAKYYYDQAKRIAQGLEGGLLPMGTVTFAQLANQSKQAGYMYNISDAFTTDATFREGAGHAYPAGTNVYWTADGKWDCLAGYQVTSVNGETGAVTVKKLVSSAGGTFAGASITLYGNADYELLDVVGIKGSELFDRFQFVMTKSNGRPWMHLFKNGAQASGAAASQQFYTTAFPQPSVTGNAGTATKLATPRQLGVNLARTAASTFDGSANQLEIPVKGVLPVANGGTGNSTGKAPTAGAADTATKLAASKTIGISGAVTGTATAFDGSNNITIPTTGIDVGKANAGVLPIARGGTGLNNSAELEGIDSSTLASVGAVLDGNSYYTGVRLQISTASDTAYPQPCFFTKRKSADIWERQNLYTSAHKPTASDVGAVPTSRKVNNKALSGDITLSASDVGALPSNGKAGTAGTADKLATANVGSATRPVYFANGIPVQTGTSLGVSVTGNAGTATKLQTPRTINGVSFDGSADIVLPKPETYHISGFIANADRGTFTGYGSATVEIEPTGFVRIYYSYSVENNETVMNMFRYGLNRDLLKGLVPALPKIKPIIGGRVLKFYPIDGRYVLDKDFVGYGATHIPEGNPDNPCFWAVGRVYDTTGTVGPWPANALGEKGQMITGVALGVVV